MIARGQPLPDWYLDEPVVEPADRHILVGFWRLSTTRTYGMGFIGPIPHDRIEDYADRAHMDPDAKEIFTECVREMDAGYLAFKAEDAKRKGKDKAPTEPAPPTTTLGRHSRRKGR